MRGALIGIVAAWAISVIEPSSTASAVPTSPAAQSGDCGAGKFHCRNGDGDVTVSGTEQSGARPPEPTVGPIAASGKGGQAGSTGPAIPAPVVHSYDCGTALPPEYLRNAQQAGGVDCLNPLIECQLGPGQAEDPNYTVVSTVTTQPDGTSSSSVACAVPVGAAGPAKPVLTGAQVSEYASRHLPQGTVTSTGATSLANLKTVFWLGGVTQHTTLGPVTILATEVRIRATLVTVHWDFGDGTSTTSTDPGTPYDPKFPCDKECTAHFGHAYTTKAGPMTITAQASWHVEFAIGTGPYTALTQPATADPATPTHVTILQAHSQLLPN